MSPTERNIFHQNNGAALIHKPVPFFLTILTIALIGSLVGKGGIIVGIAFIFLPVIVTYLYFIFKNPRVGLIGLFISNYLILGLTRYVSGIPFGMSIDFQLIIIFIALFFQSFFHKIPWENTKNDLFAIAVIWFGWITFQILNPEAISRVAWFYSMRSVGLYMVLTIPLIFILFDRLKDLRLFLNIWAVLAIIGALKGIGQKFIGLDPFEYEWLMGPARNTHVLFGNIRIFSFFTDAGQFGAAMAHSGVVFSILALRQKESKKLKILYAIAGICSFYGMIISGTRGAIAVPLMGFGLYIVLQRNIKLFFIGVLLGISVFVFFKYTTIGQGNYTISRMRTAFNPKEDRSLQVRLENQRILKDYMTSRPIGAGIGSTGRIAAQQAPHSVAAQIPTDSWYVLIWVEQGIVGLILHMLILLYIVIKSSYTIAFKLKDPWVKAQLAALLSGFFGIMIASYGNAIFGQMPTVIILYSTMAFLFMAKKFDNEALELQKIKEKQEKNNHE